VTHSAAVIECPKCGHRPPEFSKVRYLPIEEDAIPRLRKVFVTAFVLLFHPGNAWPVVKERGNFRHMMAYSAAWFLMGLAAMLLIIWLPRQHSIRGGEIAFCILAQMIGQGGLFAIVMIVCQFVWIRAARARACVYLTSLISPLAIDLSFALYYLADRIRFLHDEFELGYWVVYGIRGRYGETVRMMLSCTPGLLLLLLLLPFFFRYRCRLGEMSSFLLSYGIALLIMGSLCIYTTQPSLW